MGYLHIDNLYKAQDVFLFQRLYALEKIHGTSAHISWENNQVGFFSGGAKYEEFVALFNAEELAKRFTELSHPAVTVYGEAYGGKMQGMRDTYGPQLKFIVFDVQIGNRFLAVPQAENVAKTLSLEFVDYAEIPAILEVIDAERDKPSAQAQRNNMSNDKKREGIVLRPLIEVYKNNGQRIIAKHKNVEFQETKTPRPVKKPDELKVLTEADAVAEEWVTPMRLSHVLDKLPGEKGPENTREVIKAMLEDVEREAKGEIVLKKETVKAIGRKTAELFHAQLRNSLKIQAT